MRPQLPSLLQLPQQLRLVSQAFVSGWLLLAGLPAVAQAPTSIPEPLIDNPAPARMNFPTMRLSFARVEDLRKFSLTSNLLP